MYSAGLASMIRVFLADDHPMILAGVRALLAPEPDIEVVGEAGDGRTTLTQILALRPDVAVIDLSMPGLNGIELVKALAASYPDCRCVVLSVHEDRVYVRRMLELGAAGYLAKRSAAGELVRAIRAAAQGQIYLDPVVAGQALGPSGTVAPRGETLSAREAEVLRLGLSGHSNKAIAAILGIAVKTVEAHKARATEKLGFDSRVDLLRYAVAEGWLAADEGSFRPPDTGIN